MALTESEAVAVVIPMNLTPPCERLHRKLTVHQLVFDALVAVFLTATIMQLLV
jgi:hypothetical protein